MDSIRETVGPTDKRERQWPLYTALFLLFALLYLTIIRLLRYRRLKDMQKRYPYHTRDSLANMTISDASEIQRQLVLYEFPFVYLKSLEFALFKTYGTPSISRLLLATRQLLDPTLAPKRYVDTSTLIREFCMHDRASPRYAAAIARMNYLHGVYQRTGRIRGSDMLYTLSLFVLEPLRWIERYEWRRVTPMERCAVATFWKSVGDDMGIAYDELLDGVGTEGRTHWRDGLDWLEDLTLWSERYEVEKMVPCKENARIAQATIKVLLWAVPTWAHGFGTKIICTLLEDRLREAMILPAPPLLYTHTTQALLHLRRLTIRYLHPPRPLSRPNQYLSTKPNRHGRYTLLRYDNIPLYVAPTWWNRWADTQAWWWRLVGKDVPGGEHWREEGGTCEEEDEVVDGHEVEQDGRSRRGGQAVSISASSTSAGRSHAAKDANAETTPLIQKARAIDLCPRGYRIEDLGPANFLGKGAAEMERFREEIGRVDGRVACPFG